LRNSALKALSTATHSMETNTNAKISKMAFILVTVDLLTLTMMAFGIERLRIATHSYTNQKDNQYSKTDPNDTQYSNTQKMTPNEMTLSKATFSKMTLSIVTLSIITFSIWILCK